MRIAGVAISVVVSAVFMADPAAAAFSGPAPSNLALFLLGVAGLAIGRRTVAGRNRPKDDSAA